jgi:hypothetical protein
MPSKISTTFKTLWKRTEANILGALHKLRGMFDFNRFSQSAQSGVVRHISGNAFKPILLLVLITASPFLAAAYLFRADRAICLFLIAAATIPMTLACVTYACFAYFKPEKLQSESFQLRQQAMQLVEQKGKGFAVSPISLEAISNPATGLLEAGEGPRQRQ